MKSIAIQDEVTIVGSPLRQPPQVRPVCRAPFADGPATEAAGVEPQRLLICPYEGECFIPH